MHESDAVRHQASSLSVIVNIMLASLCQISLCLYFLIGSKSDWHLVDINKKRLWNVEAQHGLVVVALVMAGSQCLSFNRLVFFYFVTFSNSIIVSMLMEWNKNLKKWKNALCTLVTKPHSCCPSRSRTSLQSTRSVTFLVQPRTQRTCAHLPTSLRTCRPATITAMSSAQ